MAIQTLNTIKNWFKTNLKPTQAQFWDTWDSFRHKQEKVPVADIEGIDVLLSSKASKAVLDAHLIDEDAHNIFIKKSEKGFTSFGGTNLLWPHDLGLGSEDSNIMITSGIGVIKGFTLYPEAKNYPGKIYTITNKQTNDVVLLHDDATASVGLYFSNAQDYTCKPNEVVTFRFNSWGKFEMVASSMPASDPASWDTLTGKPTTFAPSSHSHPISEVTGLASELDNKVDKVTGKGLSTEDFTSLEKTKLAAFPANAEPVITGGTASQYWNGLKGWTDFATTARASVLTGFSSASSSLVTAADSFLVAIGKLQGQVSNKALAVDITSGTDVLKIPTAKAISDALIVPDKELVITTGGVINNQATSVSRLLRFTNSVTPTILSGLADPVDGKTVTFINNTLNSISLLNESASSTAVNRLKNTNDVDITMLVGSVAQYRYFASIQRWVLIDLWATDYFSSLVGPSKRAVSVTPNGYAVGDEIVELKYWDTAKTTVHTKATLNTSYPLIKKGQQVICPNITPNGVIYEKYDDTTNEWIYFNTTKLT